MWNRDFDPKEFLAGRQPLSAWSTYPSIAEPLRGCELRTMEGDLMSLVDRRTAAPERLCPRGLFQFLHYQRCRALQISGDQLETDEQRFKQEGSGRHVPVTLTLMPDELKFALLLIPTHERELRSWFEAFGSKPLTLKVTRVRCAPISTQEHPFIGDFNLQGYSFEDKYDNLNRALGVVAAEIRRTRGLELVAADGVRRKLMPGLLKDATGLFFQWCYARILRVSASQLGLIGILGNQHFVPLEDLRSEIAAYFSDRDKVFLPPSDDDQALTFLREHEGQEVEFRFLVP